MRPIRLLTLFALVTTACGTAAPADNSCPATPPSFATFKKSFLPKTCALSDSCHNANGHKGSLDLETDPYKAIINVGTFCMDPCMTAKTDYPTRVVPGDSAKSFFYVKMAMSVATDAKLGDRMPQSSFPIDAATLKQWQCWIDAGAPNN